jgi:transcriptional repressor NrdR
VHLRDLTVLKKSGETETFDPEKLARSLRLALHKRPISSDQTERILGGLIRQLEMMGEVEIPSQVIGEKVMEALSSLDSVAFIRFASIYKNFQEAKDFKELVEALSQDRPLKKERRKT